MPVSTQKLSIQGLGSPTWNKGKENETIVSASQDMIYTNKISVVDVTFDENSPVSLADRLFVFIFY
jgi:hypothetical protein